MPHLPNGPDYEASAELRDDEVDDKIAELFLARPPTVDEFFADPIVRMRIGMLIAQAMSTPTGPQRRRSSH